MHGNQLISPQQDQAAQLSHPHRALVVVIPGLASPILHTVRQQQVLVFVKCLQLANVDLLILKNGFNPVIYVVCHSSGHLGFLDVGREWVVD